MTQPADIRRAAGAGAPGSSEDARRGWRRGRGWLSQAPLPSAQSRPRPPRCGAVRPRRTPRRAEGAPAGRAALPAGGSNRRGAVAAEGCDCPAPAALTGLSLPASRLASPAPLPQGWHPPPRPSRARSGGTVKTVNSSHFRTDSNSAAPSRAAPRSLPLPANPLASLLSPPLSPPDPPREEAKSFKPPRPGAPRPRPRSGEGGGGGLDARGRRRGGGREGEARTPQSPSAGSARTKSSPTPPSSPLPARGERAPAPRPAPRRAWLARGALSASIQSRRRSALANERDADWAAAFGARSGRVNPAAGGWGEGERVSGAELAAAATAAAAAGRQRRQAGAGGRVSEWASDTSRAWGAGAGSGYL